MMIVDTTNGAGKQLVNTGRRILPALLRLSLVVALIITQTRLAAAHREVLTAEEKEVVKTAERIHVQALALTEAGLTDAAGIKGIVMTRLRSLGYAVMEDAAQPHDVTVKVKCEQWKTWEGPLTSGGDADQPDAAARLWKGPACQMTYRVHDHSADWRHEVRGAAPAAPMPAAGQADVGARIIGDLTRRLADDPFPFLLAGAWNQTSRLLKALDEPTTSQAQKSTIITLLGNMFAVEAIPALSRTLHDQDPALAQHAALALGAIGHEDCIPVLLAQLNEAASEPRLRAIKGLGRLAPLHPNSGIVPALLARLPREPVPAQIEIVRALGKTTDRRILEPLRALNRSVQQRTRSDSGAEWKELKQALGQSLDQFDGVHTEE